MMSKTEFTFVTLKYVNAQGCSKLANMAPTSEAERETSSDTRA